MLERYEDAMVNDTRYKRLSSENELDLVLNLCPAQ
jgi:hypothetical protein